nr:lacZ alpha peptide [unidentified cloning vector]
MTMITPSYLGDTIEYRPRGPNSVSGSDTAAARVSFPIVSRITQFTGRRFTTS